MRPATASAQARAALAGNPSDGYGGRTLAVALGDFSAEACVAPAAAFSFGTPGDRAAMAPLVDAAIARFARLAGGALAPCAVEVRTTIPRQLGLAGSSAIVIAVLRALAAATGTALEPRVLAAEALAAETEELGIAAGPQDRLVQAFGGLLYMDFATGDVEALPAEALPPLFVAHQAATGAPSGTVHGALRRRFEAGDRAVVDGMRRLADLTADARAALLARDVAAFAALLGASFDLRADMVALDPAEAAGVLIAREHGLHANYAGSGGAVVGVFQNADRDRLAEAYRRAGWKLVAPVTPG